MRYRHDKKEWISQRWERLADGRYYEARLSYDLLGDWVITKNWGYINKASGRMVRQSVTSYEEGLEIVFAVLETREKKRYNPVLFTLCPNR